MSELPDTIRITEEGPREGFQIESSDIATDRKIALIDALSATGVPMIQVCSFVNPKLVPGWADAEAVVRGFTPKEGVKYVALWFNARGADRAREHADRLTLDAGIHLAASEAFSRANLNRDREGNLEAMRALTAHHVANGQRVRKIMVMAAFGCNFAGRVPLSDVLQSIEDGLGIAAEYEQQIDEIAMADTMGWGNPALISRVVGEVRSRWPETPIRLHLHDTRGLGIANAHAGLQLGVSRFDTTVGGLGGCPFAAHKGAPGNIATEELVLLAEELGIDTGIDLDALVEVGHLAESIVGHTLPSAMLRGGSLHRFL